MDFNLQYRNVAFYEPFAEAGSSNVNRILREIFEQRLGERRKRKRKKRINFRLDIHRYTIAFYCALSQRNRDSDA